MKQSAPSPAPARSRLLAGLIGLSAVVVTACQVVPPPPAPQVMLSTSSNTDAATAFDLLNKFRVSAGLPALTRVAELDAKAQLQAQRMADEGHISHTTDLTSGVTPGWKLISENVAMSGSVQQAQVMLEGSPPHRANMLNSVVNQAGVAVVKAKGAYWVVQQFVQR